MRIINVGQSVGGILNPLTGPVVPKLKALFLDSADIDEGTATGTLVGAIQNITAGSVITLTNAAGDRFALDGTNIDTGATLTDWAVAQFHDIQLTETNGAFANSPRVSIIRIAVNQMAAGPDITPPVLTMPSASVNGVTAIDGMVMTNEDNGTLFWYTSQSAVAPSIADLKSGVNADVSGFQAIIASGMTPVAISGVVEDNTYYVHYLHTDAAGNDSNIATSGAVTITDAIPVPVLVLPDPVTETLSFGIDGLIPDNIAGNFDWYVEVAGDAGFTTGPGAEATVRISQRQVLLSDFVDDDEDGNPEVEPFAATVNLPLGNVWVRISLKSDDGQTGDPSNVITQNITSLGAFSFWDGVAGVDRDPLAEVTGSPPLTVACKVNDGTNNFAKSQMIITGKKQIEFTHDNQGLIANSSAIIFGVTDAANDASAAGVDPGRTSSGCLFRVEGVAEDTIARSFNGGIALFPALSSLSEVGDVYTMRVDEPNNTVGLQRSRFVVDTWVTETVGSITMTSQIPTDYVIFAGGKRGNATDFDQLTANAGATPFVVPLSDGYTAI